MTRALCFCKHRKQTVNADALTPTWQPMTSTIGVFGLLHFSLRTMAGENSISLKFDCISGGFLCQYFFQNNLKLKPTKNLKKLCPHTDDCNAPRSSSVYQQGEAVFLEASVEAPLHPPLTVYVDYCVATLKPDPLSSPSYRFITNYGSVGPSGSKNLNKTLCICGWFKVLNSTQLKWFSVERTPTPKPNTPLMKLFSSDYEFYLNLYKFAHAHRYQSP